MLHVDFCNHVLDFFEVDSVKLSLQVDLIAAGNRDLPCSVSTAVPEVTYESAEALDLELARAFEVIVHQLGLAALLDSASVLVSIIVSVHSIRVVDFVLAPVPIKRIAVGEFHGPLSASLSIVQMADVGVTILIIELTSCLCLFATCDVAFLTRLTR